MGGKLGDAVKLFAGVALMFVPGQWAWLAHLAGSMLIADSLTEDPPKPEEGLEGALANQNSNKAPIPVIYGTRRVGGTRVFMGSSGAKNKFMHMVLVVAEGPIKGFRALYIDDALAEFYDYSNDRGEWVRPQIYSSSDEDGSPFQTYDHTYDVDNVVTHNGEIWRSTTSSNTTEPGAHASWVRHTTIGTIQGVDTDGVDTPITRNEYGKVYLQVGVGETANFDVDNFIAGQTSGATAAITGIDATNHRIFIDSIQRNLTSNRTFYATEVIEERTARDSGPTGTIATGVAPMLNNEPVYFKDASGAGNPGYTVTGERMPTTSTKINGITTEYKNLVQVYFHNGQDDQAADTVLEAAHPDWTSAHQLKGKAYIYVRFEYNKDKLTGIPNISALIDGMEVFDPRSSQTTTTLDKYYTVLDSGGVADWSSVLTGANPVIVGEKYRAAADIADLDTTLVATGASVGEHNFSANSALCVRDYLSNSFYGRGLSYESIDDSAIVAAANYCDEVITLSGAEFVEPADPGTAIYKGPRYTTNARIDTGQTIFNNIQSLLASMRGNLSFTGGMYRLLPIKQTPSYHTFDDTNIIGGIKATLGNKRNTFNEVKITYPNPDANWASDEVIYFSDTIKDTLDNGLQLVKDSTLNTITSHHQAMYIALQEFKQSRQQISITFKTGGEGLLVEVGDVIRVRSLQYGWGTVADTIDGLPVNVYNTRTGAVIDPHELFSSGVVNGDDGVTKGDALGTGPMYKEFLVMGVSVEPNLEVTISAAEYDPEVFTTYPATVEDTSPNTNLSDARISLPPTNLLANEYLYVSRDTSGFKAALQLTWDTSDSSWDASYQVSVREPFDFYVSGNAYTIGTIVRHGGGFWQCSTAISINETVDVSPGAPSNRWTSITDTVALNSYTVAGTTDERNFTIKDAKEGTYLIKVQAINVNGKLSLPEVTAYTIAGLSAPPKRVTGLGLIVNNDTAVLTWDKATDLDVLISGGVQIRHAGVTDLTTFRTDASIERLWQASTIITEGKSGATTQVFLPLKIGTYMVKFIDAGGNFSELPSYVTNTIAPASASTLIASISERLGITETLSYPLVAAAGTVASISGDVSAEILAGSWVVELYTGTSITQTTTMVSDAFVNPNTEVTVGDTITGSPDNIKIYMTGQNGGFNGLVSPADTSKTSTGLEKISHGGQDIMQFTTAAGTTFADTATVSSSQYYLANQFSFTDLVDAELEVVVDATTYNVGNLVSSWVDIDSLGAIDDPAYGANVVSKISTTTDDPNDANAVWSEYFTFLSGTVKCRGARALVEISVNEPTAQVHVKDIDFNFYGKDRVESNSDLQWTAADFALGYKDIWFTSPFFSGGGIEGAAAAEPILNINISSSIPGLSYSVTNGTKAYQGGPGVNGPDTYSGFRITIFQSTALNTAITPLNAVVDFGYQAIGY